MGRNVTPQFITPEMAPADKIKELRGLLEQYKSAQPPTVNFTPVSTVSFSMVPTNPTINNQFATTIHAIIATLNPPQSQVLFAVPEVDAFQSLVSTPTISLPYLWPYGSNSQSPAQYFDLSVWYDYYNTNGNNIVAKIYARDRIFTTFSDAWGPTYVTVVVRWRYLTPGAS